MLKINTSLSHCNYKTGEIIAINSRMMMKWKNIGKPIETTNTKFADSPANLRIARMRYLKVNKDIYQWISFLNLYET